MPEDVSGIAVNVNFLILFVFLSEEKLNFAIDFGLHGSAYDF